MTRHTTFTRDWNEHIASIMRVLREVRDTQSDPVEFFAGLARIAAEELQLTRTRRKRGDVYDLVITDEIEKLLRKHRLSHGERRLLLARINLQIAEELVLEAEKLLGDGTRA